MTTPVSLSPSQDLAARALPLLLKDRDGQPIQSAAQWQARRAEILELFRSQIYGRAPVDRPADLRFRVEETDPHALNGAATFKRIAIEFSGLKRAGQETAPVGRITLLLFTPNALTKPAPTFLLVCHRAANLDATRAEKTEFWPVETLIARGYGAAAFLASDLDPDSDDDFRNGVHGLFDPVLKEGETRAGDAWGTISAWSWGASRALDYLETDAAVDARRVVIIGHSRGGKTALWTGAQDERFALTVSNCSGNSGAALARGNSGETLEQINKRFPHWFARNYRAYNGRARDLPLDQHWLLALVAPRAVLIGSASQDAWADPKSEFLSGVAASPLYERLGQKGLEGATWPRIGQLRGDGSIGYYLREGKHALNLASWRFVLDYADGLWKNN